MSPYKSVGQSRSLIIPQLVKKLPSFCKTGRFIYRVRENSSQYTVPTQKNPYDGVSSF
jgi:hypothetical protein